VARARAARATVALALRTVRQPDEDALAPSPPPSWSGTCRGGCGGDARLGLRAALGTGTSCRARAAPAAGNCYPSVRLLPGRGTRTSCRHPWALMASLLPARTPLPASWTCHPARQTGTLRGSRGDEPPSDGCGYFPLGTRRTRRPSAWSGGARLRRAGRIEVEPSAAEEQGGGERGGHCAGQDQRSATVPVPGQSGPDPSDQRRTAGCSLEQAEPGAEERPGQQVGHPRFGDAIGEAV
jgi:hypothetical protein